VPTTSRVHEDFLGVNNLLFCEHVGLSFVLFVLQ
jgi:hypothetical protein